jgi:spore coat polysaccharide biosynthesis protein SpsF
MTIGAIIQARMGSSRLPGKVLMKINNEECILEYMIKRVRKSKSIEKIIIATSNNKIDDKIYEFCNNRKIICFRGSENDVLERYYNCSKEHNLSIIVRLTADCPLIDPEIIDLCISNYLKGEYDYYSNTCPPNLSKFPDGSDVEVFNISALGATYLNTKDQNDREHVTFHMWKHDNGFKTGILNNKIDLSNLRYTVDYKEDLEVVRFLTSQINKKYLKGSVQEISQILFDNPEIVEKNCLYYQGVGWKTKKGTT